MLVVDLRHWLLDSGDLHPEASLAPHVALVVECATAFPAPGVTAMRCRRFARRVDPCPGHLGTVIGPDEQTIFWRCDRCADAGSVTGFRGTAWDFLDLDVDDTGDRIAVYVPTDELRRVRDLACPPQLRMAMLARWCASTTCPTPQGRSAGSRLCAP